MRTPLSKKIRFEIFKRDKFTCQYCGGKSPNVILNVDHIEPVATGGTNEIMNLITSCFECNNGKRAIPLSDESVVEKQRKQLEELQERREQIELMFEWKKSLSELDSDINGMIGAYINSKMHPWPVKENFKTTIQKWLNKYDLQDILDAIDISSSKYLRFENGDATDQSAEDFLNKIGGILHNKNLSPIQQKLSYIKGIARNRFGYWDDRKGSIILSNYVQALKKHWTDDQILDDLDKEVEKETKQADNWSQWRGIIEGWTDDINEKWGKTTDNEVLKEGEIYSPVVRPSVWEKDYSQDDLESFVNCTNSEQNDFIKALEHIALLFPGYDQATFNISLRKELLNFLQTANDFDSGITEGKEVDDFIDQYVSKTFLTKIFSDYYEEDIPTDNFGVLMALENSAYDLLIQIFKYYYMPKNLMKRQYSELLVQMHIVELKAELLE